MNQHQCIKTITVILIFLMAVSPGFSKKLVTLPELVNPEKIIIQYDKIFVTQGVEIFVYSLNDFKLLTKFGKPGEGPREFKITPPDYPLEIEILPTSILVNSLGRVSYYTHQGEFLSEKTPPHHWTRFQTIGENFVYESFAIADGVFYRVFSLCDANFKKIKEFYRQKHVLNAGTLTILKEVPKFQVVKDKIFVSGKEGFVIDIFDKNGELLRTINLPYEKRKANSESEKKIMEFFKTKYKNTIQQYQELIKTIEVAQTFPAINEFRYSEPYLYVSTCKEKDEKREFYIFDSDGNLLMEKVYLPLIKEDLLQLYPYHFYKNKAYQLIENNDTEAIELHVFDVDVQKK